VKYLVLDEVDRMFDMGFYQDVEKIIKYCPTERQNLFFSATISADIDYLVKRHTKDPVTVSTSSYVDPTKLEQVYYDTPGNMKFSLLVHLLKHEESKLVMVFCNTKRTADIVAKMLTKAGIDASAIHGDLSQNQRQRTLEKFHSNKIGVLVCTDVAARGLDIKGVSHVYNYDLPSKSDDYIHRVGRTARAKKEGKAISILANRDY
jgi:ATP-dependent RNA helicase DeaD